MTRLSALALLEDEGPAADDGPILELDLTLSPTVV